MGRIDQEVIRCGLLAADGSILDDNDFLGTIPLVERAMLADLARTNPDDTSFEIVEDGTGVPQVVAVAPLALARRWQGPPILAPGGTSTEAVAICQLTREGVHRRLQEFGEAFGLTSRVVRTVIALYDHGDVREAAAATGIAFHTAREYLNEARAAIWAPNLPRLITWASVGSLGTDASGESDEPVANLFSLSERQRRIAARIVDGSSRSDAARELGISDALAKKELAAVYAATGASNAIGLARTFGELRALAIMTRSRVSEQDRFPAPAYRTITAEHVDGRRVVGNDYGPFGGKPVMVLHNTMNCRGVDRSLVYALQERGFRPVSIDRPGYGDTDPAPVDCHGSDYLSLCARDFALVCKTMRWSQVPVIAHGPVHVVLALLREQPELLGPMVIDAPEPDSNYGSKAQGMMASLKRQFARRPWAVAAVVRMLCTLVNYDRIATSMQQWTQSSPADHAAMSDPALMMDFYRKMHPFRTGKIDGFVREQVVQATMGRPQQVTGTDGIALIVGQTDFMHDADENLAYWSEVLPDARQIKLADAGRFISYTHPEALVDALEDMLRVRNGPGGPKPGKAGATSKRPVAPKVRA